MTSTQKHQKRDTKAAKNDEVKTTQKQLTLDATIANDNGAETSVLAELRKFRQESAAGFEEVKASQTRLETSVGEIKQQMDNLKERLTSVENSE